MNVTYESKTGRIDCYQHITTWNWVFHPDFEGDQDPENPDHESIRGGPCESKEECKMQWEMLGITPHI